MFSQALKLILFGIFLPAGWFVHAGPKFTVSEVAGPCQQLILCDLDGDGLEDLVLMNGTNLSIFYQDSEKGFTREPQQTYQLPPRPGAITAARLGKSAESLLFMTSDGVTEISFANRTGHPVVRQVISQPTILPAAAENTNPICVPFSVRTGRGSPLLLLPTAGGLQVWQSGDGWHQAQTINHAISALRWPAESDPGLMTRFGLDMSIGDVNGDGRDDLMIRRQIGRTNRYELYLQQTNGLFGAEPALTYADQIERFSWFYWGDLNHDGKLDLIKSVWLNEPSFVPAVPSGKVVVRTYFADQRSRIPSEPQQVFRKNDWLAALPVVDVDGDGFPDLILGYSDLDGRDSLIKEITTRELDYRLEFYFYRPGVGYPTNPDCHRDLVLHLERSQPFLDWVLPQNFMRCIKLDGDFNGDGKRDLLVQNQSDAISIYFFVSGEQGFSPEPDLRFNCPEAIDILQVADLNHDGISDLIVQLEHEGGLRIFISHK